MNFKIIKIFTFFKVFVCLLLTVVECFPRLDEYDIWADFNQSRQFADRFVNDSNNIPLNSSENYDRFPRVLNFFPVPFEDECKPNDGRRKGVCMNTYECRIQGGVSKGPCAIGFGVCCVFTVSCGDEINNNITYFVNPDFPDLSTGVTTCEVKLKKIDTEISQIRLDFIHFNLGQPNRRTGVCEEDIFALSGGNPEVTICGINSGQHVFVDVENMNEVIQISMNLSNKIVPRLWEVQIIQVPLSQRPPAGCFQYFTGPTGVIQTMNFAENGRHLADQDYDICIRQEQEMCSIAYEPCDENSFRIGANSGVPQASPTIEPMPQTQTQTPQAEVQMVSSSTVATMAEMDQDVGSGDMSSRMMEVCGDKIVMPCDSEDLIMEGDAGPGFCDLVHCGSSFCPMGESPCRIETSVIPFLIKVHFGPAAREAAPDDNLGMCLKYEQIPCVE